MAIEVGDYVQVTDRVPSPVDQKSGLFYNHFRNLAGVVDRIYADGAICVVVDHATLTRDMLARLKRAERVIKPRWKTAGPAEPVPAPGPENEVPAGDAETGDEDGVVDASAEPGEAAAEAAPDESGDLRVNPGLRYAIVIRPDDVELIRKGTGAPGEAALPRRDPGTALRVSEEQLQDAERRHMEELLNRANAPK